MKSRLRLYAAFIFASILIDNVNGNMFKLEENPKFKEIDCNSLKIEVYCTDKSVNNWCRWNNDLSICENNYLSILFLSPWDIAALSKSTISLLILIGCMALYWFSGSITKQLKVFKHMESDKIDKCQIYIFELLGLTISMWYLLYIGTFNIIFFPQNYANIEPVAAIDLVRSLSCTVFLMYMYLIEMLTNDLRWSLKLHHTVVIFIGIYYMYLLDGFADLASLRCILAISFYGFTEHNVFAQLLLYRISPLYSWKIHFLSAIIYTMTRIFGTVSFIYCYISWSMTDRIYNQFNGTEKIDIPYIIFFCLMPVLTILLNIAQFQTVKALFYISNSTKKRIFERNELRKNPRLQKLYDIFIEFDSNDNGYWTMMDWKKFIFYHSTFIKHETCILLWNVLGFTSINNNDELSSDLNESVTGYPPQHSNDGIVTDTNSTENSMDKTMDNKAMNGRNSTITERDIAGFEDKINIKHKKKQYMKWKDFRKIFGKHMENEKLNHYSIKKIISAQLQILLQTIFNAQSQFEQFDNVDDRDMAMLRLYNDVNISIIHDKKKQNAISRRLSKVNGIQQRTEYDDHNDIEMVISSPDNINGNGMGIPSPDNIQYASSLNNDCLINKQLKLDDAIRQNSNRASSIMVNIPFGLKEEKTI